MEKCKTCEFFNADPEHWPSPLKEWGDCKNEDVFQDASDFPFVESSNKVLFKYSADIEGSASFEVHENFGCVAHKKILKKT